MKKKVDKADLMEMESEIVNQINFENNKDCEVNNLTLKKLQEGLSLAENFKSFFLNADEKWSAEKESRKFKRELQNYLFPYYEIYNDFIRSSEQSKITNFLKSIEGAKHLNEKKGSETESDIVQSKKFFSFNYWAMMRKKFIKLRSH